jgi:hypothetical protein
MFGGFRFAPNIKSFSCFFCALHLHYRYLYQPIAEQQPASPSLAETQSHSVASSV